MAGKKESARTPRKVRSDATVGTFEKKQGLPPGTIRNPGGRDTRSDKKIGTIREEANKKGKKSASFLDPARSLNLNGPRDWSERVNN